MLYLGSFDIIQETKDSPAIMTYHGERAYLIQKDGAAFSLTVVTKDENGDETACEGYACATLSIAIASIEDLESGKEI